ncbi:MAG: efflux RND transporter periplasmic adaptor subunit [Planctomycetes bacterium]|nr:efflux RND transporter periplasmic adaptor subunit [Planctomycetota bacterium]
MRLLRTLLPAAAFFVLLGAALAFGFLLGRDHAPVAELPLYTCSMDPEVRRRGPGLCPVCGMELVPASTLAREGKVLPIDPVVVQQMGVRVTRVARARLTRSLRAAAVLRAPEDGQRDVTLRVGGFVETLHAHTLGMQLELDDPLFELYSPELVVAQEELIASRRSGDPELLAAAREKLLRWGLPAALVDELAASDRSRRTVTFRSPVRGVLVRREIVAGAPAPAGTPLLRLADLDRLWLDVNLPEARLPKVPLGTPATATIDAYPGESWSGTVVFRAPQLDEASRTGVVRIALGNQDGRLRPGMFATVRFALLLADDALVVPMEAVLDTGTRRVVWLAHGGGRFEPRDVVAGPTGDDGLTQILDGLAENDAVVVSGQYLIDSESRFLESIRKLSDEGLMAGGSALPAAAAVAIEPAARLALDTTLTAYLALTAAFAADRDDDPAWQALIVAARSLADALPADFEKDAAALRASVAGDATGLAKRRELLVALSSALVAITERARPGPSIGALAVMHCPMVPADWLQLGEQLRNPYYGSEMLECGELKTKVPVAEPKR